MHTSQVVPLLRSWYCQVCGHLKTYVVKDQLPRSLTLLAGFIPSSYCWTESVNSSLTVALRLTQFLGLVGLPTYQYAFLKNIIREGNRDFYWQVVVRVFLNLVTEEHPIILSKFYLLEVSHQVQGRGVYIQGVEHTSAGILVSRNHCENHCQKLLPQSIC